MKNTQYKFIKTFVFIMSLCLVGGFVFLIYAIITKSNLSESSLTTIQIPQNFTDSQVNVQDHYLILNLTDDNSNIRYYIIDIHTGKLVKEVVFTTDPPK